jgi:transcriptional regulator with XRE-family HTH domain
MWVLRSLAPVRKARGFSQARLATASGTTQSLISDLELLRPITDRMLVVRLAAVLAVDIDTLCAPEVQIDITSPASNAMHQG